MHIKGTFTRKTALFVHKVLSVRRGLVTNLFAQKDNLNCQIQNDRKFSKCFECAIVSSNSQTSSVCSCFSQLCCFFQFESRLNLHKDWRGLRDEVHF